LDELVVIRLARGRRRLVPAGGAGNRAADLGLGALEGMPARLTRAALRFVGTLGLRLGTDARRFVQFLGQERPQRSDEVLEYLWVVRGLGSQRAALQVMQRLDAALRDHRVAL